MLKPKKNMERSTVDSEKKLAEILYEFEKLKGKEDREDALVNRIKSLYSMLNDPEKERLFQRIIETIEVSKDAIRPHLQALEACDQDEQKWSVSLAELRRHIYSPRINLLRKISRSPGGLRFLLDFRRDLLSV